MKGKIKKITENLAKFTKTVIRKLPITLAIIAILTIIWAIDYNGNAISTKVLEHIYILGITLAFGTLFTEITFGEKFKLPKIIGVIISLVIAIIFDQLIIAQEMQDSFMMRLYCTYLICVTLITVYILNKKANQTLKEYVLKVICNLFKISITYGIMVAGISAVCALFIILILDGTGGDLLITALILSVGFYYIPACISAFIDVKEEVGKFFKTIINYLLVPLAEVATVILYMYFIKMFISHEVIHNAIFEMLVTLFLTCMPIALMSENFESKNSRIFSKYFKYLFIPLYLVEIYAVAIRVSNYGLTVDRYLGVIALILQAIFLALYIIKDGKYLHTLYIFLSAATIIFMITPLNFIDFPVKSQEKIFKEFLDTGKAFEELNLEEQSRYYSVYNYLIKYEEGKKFIDNNLTEEEKNQILLYRPTATSTYSKYNLINLSKDLNLDVSGYNYIYKAECDITYSDQRTNSELIVNFKDQTYKMDIKEYINEIIEMDKNSRDEEFEDMGVIQITGTNYYLYITGCSMYYNTEDKTFSYINIYAYVLE